MFSVLGTDDLVPINLPHQKEGNRELVIPKRFRIIATLNSYDKQFVQGLSQAIRRRFTFISLDVPVQRPSSVDWTFDLESDMPAIRELSFVIRRAAIRIARRECSMAPERIDAVAIEIVEQVKGQFFGLIADLFDFVELVRYAEESSELPHLPIGTAQLVDTVELFLTRNRQDQPDGDPQRQMDWAASVKLAPLFESDVLGPDQLLKLAGTLSAPFNRSLKRELMVISASGMHFVPET